MLRNAARFSRRHMGVSYIVENGGLSVVNVSHNHHYGASGSKNTRETEAQKLKRLELERARKQQLKVQIPDEIVVSELASRLKVNAAGFLYSREWRSFRGQRVP